jgi:hypothetical protein
LALDGERVRSNDLLVRSCDCLPAHSFYVVAVGIKNERSVIVIGVMRAEPWLSVADSSRFQRRPIEGIHRLAGSCEKRHMKALDRRAAITDPEHWVRKHAKPYYLVAVSMRMALHQTQAQWPESLDVELAAPFKIGHCHIDVMNHFVEFPRAA